MSVPGYRVSFHQTFPSRSTITTCPYIAASLSINSTPLRAQLTVVWVQSSTRQIIFIRKQRLGFLWPQKQGWNLDFYQQKRIGKLEMIFRFALFCGRRGAFSFKKNLTFAVNISPDYITKKICVTIIASAPEGVMRKQPENSPPKKDIVWKPRGPNKKWGTLGFI